MPLLANTVAGQQGQVFTVSRDIWGFEVVEALFGVLADVERSFDGVEVVVSGAFTG